MISPEQVTLVVVLISIVWGTIQHQWTEQARKRDALEIATQRRADAQKLEEDRILLAAELENRREATAAIVKDALEKRAAEIRDALDIQAAEIHERQTLLVAGLTNLKDELQNNTLLTKEAVEHAQMAYHEANTVNEKIAKLTQHAVTSNEQGNALMTGLGVTGDDTLRRVKLVEDAVVQSDAQLAAEAVQTEKRLARLEDNKEFDKVTAHQTRRMVETGEDTNQRVRNVEHAIERESS